MRKANYVDSNATEQALRSRLYREEMLVPKNKMAGKVISCHGERNRFRDLLLEQMI
jgi:hypothetical protein